MNLEWLIHPVSKETFVEEYLEKKPLVVKRNDPHYFNRLMSLEDIDVVLERGSISGRVEITMPNAQKKIPAAEYLNSQHSKNVVIRKGFNVSKMEQLYMQEKATILINASQYEWPALERLLETINNDLKTTSGANIFITPAQAQCFPAHFDEHDLFIIQIAGKKRWRIYESALYLPTQPQGGRVFDFSKLNLLYDLDIEAGDIVYFPRGFVHEVITTDSMSAHITLGCMHTTWLSVVAAYIRQLAEEEPLLRGAYMKDILCQGEARKKIIECLKQKFTHNLPLDVLAKIKPADAERSPVRATFQFTKHDLVNSERL
ncbi:JmjC domain-containing protein [Ohtaekwangia koreensis]|uniref:Cupin superfamily protein n=1 Tax=Ohtaekwangia koreensis TaxID=688867 RepID=A0A1T5M533_9BACT|nr:cupin domain-containing protein [Ohtaekwangia koreensis]SKC83351.1 Cupin superfamily protein [Ohtaekwangia koreensis]